jgi:subfamily B ATP-binding cassette protein MsbA
MRFISLCYTDLIFNPLKAVCALIYLFTINWKLSLIAFCTVPMFTVILEKLSNRSGLFYHNKMKEKDKSIEYIKTISDGNEFFKAYNLQDWIYSKGKSICKNQFIAEKRYINNDAITLSAILTAYNLPVILIYLIGAIFIVKSELTLAELFAFVQLIKTVNAPTIQLFGLLKSIKRSFVAVNRVNDILFLKEERTDGENFNTANEKIIECKDLSFGYNDENLVLDTIDFEINQNECIGIVGKSGQGKSSIIDLLCGFYSTQSGAIQFFGHNISEWNLEALRSNIAYVSQSTYLFADKIIENIRYGRQSATDAEVIEAAKIAGADEFISKMSDGYETVISCNGSELSGGERQRIALARALLKNAKILLLDEPTSSLDIETENKFIQNLLPVLKNQNTLIVSHRLSMVASCDKIYVLDSGKFVEIGTNTELISKQGHYYNLFNAQIV